MDALLIFVGVLALIAVVGHVIWVAAAAALRFVFHGPSEGFPQPVREHPLDARLRELEITTKTIRALLANGEIDAETAKLTLECLQTRRQALLRDLMAPVRIPKPIPVPPPAPELRLRENNREPEQVHAIPADEEILDVLPADPEVPPAELGTLTQPCSPELEVQPRSPELGALTQPRSPKPRRSLANVLAAFMEERNILWGELAGGMLIVGCSIALVITLWHSLESLPYFPFLLFSAITAALFGAGEYTLHHWKLETTSRGLLVIALLLVPLNLLILADPALSRDNPALEWIFKCVAILLSLGMIRKVGRDLIGVGVLPGPIDRRWLLMLAVVGTAGSELIVPPFLDKQHPQIIALTVVPILSYLGACLAVVAGLARARTRAENQEFQLPQANALFVFLGAAAFALLVTFGFLVAHIGFISLFLPYLAVPLTLAGVPILAGGLLVRRSLPDEHGGTRTAGTAVGFTGLGIMLAAVAVAWPWPWAVLAVCIINAVLLSFFAFHWRTPSAHAVALPCLALAVLLGVALSMGQLADFRAVDGGLQLAGRILSPSGGITLAVLMLLLAAVSEGLFRSDRMLHAFSYTLGASMLGIGALATTAWHGFESPWYAVTTHALAGLCALAMHLRWRRAALPYAGLGLLIAASLWSLWAMVPEDRALWAFVVALESSVLAIAAVWPHAFREACRFVAIFAGMLAVALALYTPDFPAQTMHTGTAAAIALTAFLLAHLFRRAEPAWIGSVFAFGAFAHLFIWNIGKGALSQQLLSALLAHATFALLAAAVGQTRFFHKPSPLHKPLILSACITSLLAVPLLFVPGAAVLGLAGYALWLGVLWLVLACIFLAPAWFTAFQAAISVAVIYAITAWLPEWDWFDPRSLQAYGIGLGILGLGWILARIALSSRPRVRELWVAPWPSLDRVLLGALVVGQLLLALWGAAPGTIAELMPAGYVSPFDWPDMTVHTYGAGAWVLLGVLALVLLTALRERGRASILLGLLVLAVMIPILAAGPFVPENATASALRWGLAVCYLVCSALFWSKRKLANFVESSGITLETDSWSFGWTYELLGLVAAGVLLLSAQVALLDITGARPAGPAAESLFAQMGWILSNVSPLVLLMVGLVGHAVRERSQVYAFTAGLAFNLAVSLCVCQAHYPLSPSWLSFMQANAICFSVVALAWLGARRLLGEQRRSPLLALQAALGLAIHAILLAWPLAEFVEMPEKVPDPFFADIGSVVGWLGLFLSVAAALWHLLERVPRGCTHVVGIAGFLCGVLAACTASPWDTAGSWLSFHVLEIAWCMLGLGATAAGIGMFSLRVAGVTDFFAPRELRRWLEGIGAAILMLALRGAADDPWRPFGSAAAVLVVSIMAGVLAISLRRQAYVWISGLLLDVVALLFWYEWGIAGAPDFLLVNALGLAVAAAFWTCLHLLLREPLGLTDGGRSGEPSRTESRSGEPSRTPGAARQAAPTSPFAHFAALASLGLIIMAVSILLGADLLWPPAMAVSSVLAWAAVVTVGAALTIALWDRRAGFAPPGLYILGVAAIGLALHQWTPIPADLGWHVALVLSAYAILAGLVVRICKPARDDWFALAQAILAGLVIALSVWMCLDFAALAARLAGPAAVLLLLIAAACGLGKSVKPHAVILLLGAIAAAEIAWAIPDPGGAVAWLHRNVLLMLALAGMTMLYGIALPRWLPHRPDWLTWGRRYGPALGALAGLILLVLLVQEFHFYEAAARRTPMALSEVLIVLAALVTLMISGVRFAVVPGRDPFGLSERGRMLYVYAVELLLVLLFVHLRLTEPILFRGWLSRYWTFAIMLIAFIGVGVSEFLERRRLRVLAEPLQRTGVFLPLLPLLAFWARPSTPMLPTLPVELRQPLETFHSYAFLWLLVCVLYSLVALTRRSFVFAVFAALAANFALWSLLTHHDIAFLLHPQCWLIPPALIVLAAEYINRERLRPELSAGLRYFAISMIYVSSTADLFIAGLGNSVVLPIILAVLSLAGILLGILMRVRAFMFLGISFLFLDVFTMIWYAAVDRAQTWIWWASGIVLGVAILSLFAVFEKRKNDVLRLMEEIKRWD